MNVSEDKWSSVGIYLEKTSPRKRPPPTERPYQQQGRDRKSAPEKEYFSVSSEPDILLCKTPEAVNDIPETGTNETITLGAASTSLDEMPSTEKDLMRPSNK